MTQLCDLGLFSQIGYSEGRDESGDVGWVVRDVESVLCCKFMEEVLECVQRVHNIIVFIVKVVILLLCNNHIQHVDFVEKRT